ncbi:MAG: flavin reductase family protein [Bacteriovoracaceae bacterium]|nr:flavin reductase family protein [Bacteriovoracaceae bacterium]
MKSFKIEHDFKFNYKFLIGAIVPRPIAWVSTLNIDGTDNLAPFSFFTAISANPMIIAFSPMIRSSDGKKKDTVINIEREKEFVINFVSEELIERVNLTSTEVDYGHNEFSMANLTAIKSEMVKCHRVKESPIHFECKLRDILNYGDHVGAGRLITGEVLMVHTREDVMDESGYFKSKNWHPVGRGAGNDWHLSNNIREVERLMKAQIQK